MRYKLTIAYDGTAYCGWQIQPNGTSIQCLMEQALAVLLRHPVTLSGSGRTDAGVHAKGQVAHFDTLHSIDPSRFLYSLNCLLPSDIRVFSMELVPDFFHARYSAKQKTYHYHLHLDPVADPILAPYRYALLGKLNISKLKAGAQKFLGTHDFTSFTNEAYRGSAAHDPVRTLRQFDLIEQSGGLRLELTGDGFLYKMVRNIVGTLVEVAREKLEPEQISEIFAAKNRSQAGPCAPPNALFLMHVDYNETLSNESK